MVSTAKTATKVSGLAGQVDFVDFYVNWYQHIALTHNPDIHLHIQRVSWARILKGCFHSPCDMLLSQRVSKGLMVARYCLTMTKSSAI